MQTDCAKDGLQQNYSYVTSYETFMCGHCPTHPVLFFEEKIIIAMTTKKLNEKKLIQVKNVNGCTNFGSLEIVGNKMYTIKTRSDNALSTISEYPDYRKTTRKNHKFANCMNHGNDITYHAGNLYVAPCGKYIEVVSTSTWEHHRLYCDIFLSGIAHWSGNQFIGLSS